VSAVQIDPDFLIKLIGFSNVLERQVNLEHGLRELATMTAHLLQVNNCSIMLIQEDDEAAAPVLRIYAHYGDLPAVAQQESVRLHQGIAGCVAASGQPLLITDVAHSEFAAVARHSDTANPSLIASPIWLSDRVIGVMNVNNPSDNRCFHQADLNLLQVFARFVGKSIHVVQLQNLLNSRFLQHAVAAEARASGAASPVSINPDPAKLAKIVAKTVYRELTDAGFGPPDILRTATEVIHLFNQTLEKHKRRAEREESR
jgi:L-methionine (R)-S-oxide reductase